MNPSQLQQIAREWADDMLEDLVLGLVLETHKTVKLSQLVCSHCGTQCRQFNNPLHIDIFRHDSDAIKSNDRVRCPQCNKPYGASHLARHLEKCMQLKGARRAGVKSYAEEDSSPEKDKAASAASESAKKRKKPVSKKSNSAANGLISDTISLDSVGSGVSSAVLGDMSLLPPDAAADGAPTTTTKTKKPPAKRRKKNADAAAEGAGDAASNAPAKTKKSKAKSLKAASAALPSGSASASASESASASGSTSVSTSNSPAAGEDGSAMPSSDVAVIDEDTFLDVELEDLSDF